MDFSVTPAPHRLTTLHPKDSNCSCVLWADPPEPYDSVNHHCYHDWMQQRTVRNINDWKGHAIYFVDPATDVRVIGVWVGDYLVYMSTREFLAVTVDGPFKQPTTFEGTITHNEMRVLRNGEDFLLGAHSSQLLLELESNL